MRTKNMLKHLAWGVFGLVSQQVFSQATQDDNNGGLGSFLGWNAGANQILEVRNDANKPIDWYTTALHRMRLNETVATLVNPAFGFPGITWKTGYLGLSGRPGFFTAGPGPFSRLHLVDDVGADDPNVYAQIFGYRPWMRNGITFTGNSDQSYIGHKYVGDDNTDFVIQWSDNPEGSPWGVDRMKFVFSSTYDGASRGMSSMDGMEAIRMWPSSPLTVNVGIGDFAPAGVGDPTERLDVLDGRVRIRRLPTELEADTLTQFVVVDPNGVLGWRNVPPGSGTGTACDWNILNPGTSGASTVHHVYTAVGSSTSCPDANDHVGIGTSSSTMAGKLTILETANKPSAAESAVHVTMNADSETNFGLKLALVNGQGVYSALSTGVDVIVENAIGTTTGVRSVVSLASGLEATDDLIAVDANPVHRGKAQWVMGTRSVVDLINGSDATQVYGSYNMVKHSTAVSDSTEVVGTFGGVRSNATGTRRGVWGKIYGTNSNSDDWAGYFEGEGFLSANMWQYSDAELKTDIQPLTSCSEILGQVVPRTYRFNVESNPGLGLAEGDQAGVIAAEIEEILPHLVRSVTHSEELDEQGNVISVGGTHKAVNYIGMIPYLIGAFNEQRTSLEEAQTTNSALLDRLAAQDARMDQLEAALASCCANPTNGDTRLLTHPNGDLDKAIEGDARSLHIQPNPFTERTTLHYRLERTGRMQLLANSADGKALKVLQEASLEAGAYQFNWETGDLTPGVYYITLLLDGEPIVKKAVKVDR